MINACVNVLGLIATDAKMARKKKEKKKKRECADLTWRRLNANDLISHVYSLNIYLYS